MSSLEGHIRIGVLAGWVPLSLITSRLSAFQQRYPRVRLSVAAGDLPTIESELISERLTFAITADIDPSRSPNDFVASQLWGDMEFVAVATPSYVERSGPFERSESLLLADVIEVGEGHPLLSRWVQGGDVGLQSLLAQLKPAMTVPDHDTALGVILSGHGWGFLPVPTAATALASGTLLALAVKPSAPSVALTLAYRRKKSRNLADSVFMEFWLESSPGKQDDEQKAVP